ncbi:MAG: ferrous iron transport protein A [Gorillibacterium sp.]|nr:ferrous iron transport protein A [Gorillibacterium sp.]
MDVQIASSVRLAEAKTGQYFQVDGMTVEGVLRRRLLDLGLVPGAVIEVLQRSPLGDPVAYRINFMTIALRKEETDRIFGQIVKGDEQ